MIKLKNIQFSYQDRRPVLHGIELSIQQGNLFGLLGPNGAGKSTLISIIAGLYSPSHGSVLVNGMQYSTDSTSILDKLAIVPQEYAFYLELTVYENVKYFASLYRTEHHQIEKAIGLTGLGDFKSKLAKNLSGGLKRRLNLAIGLLNEPDILILDEPTVGIDPQSRQFILQAIRDINSQGTTIIYTSHYMEEVEQLCDVIAIMDHGKILKMGSLEQLLDSERHLEMVFEQNNAMDNISEEMNSIINSYGLNIEGKLLRGELVANKNLKDVLVILESGQINVSKIHFGKQSLESLFFSLTHSALRD